MSAKVLATVSLTMIVALTTPFHELTGALRAYRVPSLVIMTIDLALRGIVGLGTIALEVLCALGLRSVGRNRDKSGSLGGVGGVLFLKSSRAADETHMAMVCRGFSGEYSLAHERCWQGIDALWITGLVLLGVLFVYLQGQV